MIFKKYNILYFTLGIIGALAIIVINMIMTDGGLSFLPIVLVLIWLIACIVTFTFLDRKKSSAIILQAREDLRFDIAVEKINELLNNNSITKKGVPIMLFNLSTALIENDENEKGLQLLSLNEYAIIKAYKAMGPFYIENNRGCAYIHLNDLENLRKSVEKMKEFIRVSTTSKKGKAMCDTYIQGLTHPLNVLSGNISYEEQYFKERLGVAQSSLERFNSLYYLGLIYSQDGRIQEAEDCFREVAEGAGSLWVAKKSREQLNMN